MIDTLKRHDNNLSPANQEWITGIRVNAQEVKDGTQSGKALIEAIFWDVEYIKHSPDLSLDAAVRAGYQPKVTAMKSIRPSDSFLCQDEADFWESAVTFCTAVLNGKRDFLPFFLAIGHDVSEFYSRRKYPLPIFMAKMEDFLPKVERCYPQKAAV